MILGIDVGTSKTAIVVIQEKTMSLVSHYSAENNAATELISEQYPLKHLDVIKELIKAIPSDILSQVNKIGITGQMHGILFWNSSNDMTNLITWQDKRLSDRNILTELQGIPGCENLKDGFGFATFYAERQNESFVSKEHCGTIHDFFAWCLTGEQGRVKMDPTNAASWGLFDVKTSSFNEAPLKQINFPLDKLPEIVPSGTKIGNVSSKWSELTGIPETAEVFVPIGDNQASVIGTGHNFLDELYITIGTGTQLSVVLPTEAIDRLNGNKRIDIRPFVNNQILAVSCPLCGGEAWKFLMRSVKSWILEMTNIELEDNAVYSKLDELGLKEMDRSDLPKFAPHFLGERWDPSLRGGISGIDFGNFGIGAIAAALAQGIVGNLNCGIDREIGNRSKVVCSGNAIRKSKLLQKAIKIEFGTEPSFVTLIEEAACGAAFLTLNK